MGILNVTPDSFSNDGIYHDVDGAVSRGEILQGQGADIIDIGGESTRPGALPVPLEEEINRVIPVIKKLVKILNVPISIDTSKSEVARQALDSGASIINDITGLESDPMMPEVARRFNAKVVIMHMKGTPLTMQHNPVYNNLIDDIINKIGLLIKNAEDKGVKQENIIIDPGLGFGKTTDHNLEILNKLSQFKKFGRPILIGPSRKSFIGNILCEEPGQRIFGVASCAAIAIKNGADIIRVHDIKEMKQVALLADAIIKSCIKN